MTLKPKNQRTGADHGTWTHYTLHGCRCKHCVEANWEYTKEWYTKRSHWDEPLIFRNEAEMVSYLTKRGYSVGMWTARDAP